MISYRISICALLVAAATTATIAAQAEGTALNRFDPSPAGDQLFGVTSAATRGHLDLHVKLVGDYAHNPLVLTHRRGAFDTLSLVETQMFTHFNATLSLWDRVSLNVNFPLAVYQTGSNPEYYGNTLQSPTHAEFGDPRFTLRGTLFGDRGDALQLGLAANLYVPAGSADSYVGEDQFRGGFEALASGETGFFYYGLSTGIQLRPSEEIITISQGTSWHWGVGFGAYLDDAHRFSVGPEAKVSIVMRDLQDRNTNAEIYLSAKARFERDWQFGVAAGPGVAEGFGSPDLRGIVSLAYTPDSRFVVVHDEPAGSLDSDGDGVLDPDDACVADPGPAADAGCPSPDSDGDGVPDSSDVCPDQVGTPATSGCATDRDSDGVPDASDKCPEQSSVGQPDPSRPGCPLPTTGQPLADADSDGVNDIDDACPKVAGPKTDDPERSGCPVEAVKPPVGTDGDGVNDDVDDCPKKKGLAASKGCPRVHIEKHDGATWIALPAIQFQTGTAHILKASAAILDEVAQLLKTNEQLKKVEVQGHTDNRGSKALNTTLSQKRAEAVVKALTARNIDASRLTAKGYGPQQPIADNGTDAGRAKNRRVQFKILERSND